MAMLSWNTEQQVQRFIDDKTSIDQLIQWCPDTEINPIVQYMKAQANRFWNIDPKVSLKLAEGIIAIANEYDDTGFHALGLMARGDALKYFGKSQEAWDALQEAGRLFLELDDDVGWARTRIGLLTVSINLQQTELGFADAEKARQIFRHHEEMVYLINLEMNLGAIHIWLEMYEPALEYLQSGLANSRMLGPDGEVYIGRFLLNIGQAHLYKGARKQAFKYLSDALAWFETHGEDHWIAFAEMNLAALAERSGQHRQALRLLFSATSHAEQQNTSQLTQIKHQMVNSYIQLHRYREARQLAVEVIGDYQRDGADFSLARALFQLALVEAELGNYLEAHLSLDKAEKIYQQLNLDILLAMVSRWRAKIYIKENNAYAAADTIRSAVAVYKDADYPVDLIDAYLTQGWALYNLGSTETALEKAIHAYDLAKQIHDIDHRYSIHLLLGRLNSQLASFTRAKRHFQAAVATVERLQKGLTITLRPDFLTGHLDALHALIQVHLTQNQVVDAFTTLERAKSQVFFAYLNAQEDLKWLGDDPQTAELLAALSDLREEHQWLYQLWHEAGHKEDADAALPDDPGERLKQLEKRIKTITEQLYIYTDNGQAASRFDLPTFDEIAASLEPEACLVAFYDDSQAIHAFTISDSSLHHHKLPVTSQELSSMVSKLQSNLRFALSTVPDSRVATALHQQFRKLSHGIYNSLIAPIINEIRGCQRLYIVPYGQLHYLPFNLLVAEDDYLFKQWETVILSAAGLITRKPISRQRSARVLAHAYDEQLPQTIREGELVHQLFGGEVKCNDQAVRNELQKDPCQVLHIAAHGEFRIAEPEFSFIQLADGHLYADDLLQQDLSYELVTLSACETGRAYVAAGDELIGLARGCLYAGAGAVLVSQWRADDDFTFRLMDRFYSTLLGGATKSQALQLAQSQIYDSQPDCHPAFWGAFQLIGNASPLS